MENRKGINLLVFPIFNNMLQNNWRFLWMVLLGIAISLLLHLVVDFPNDEPKHHFFGTLESIIITILIWEGSLRFDRILDKKFPWEHFLMKRILVQLVGGSAFISLVLVTITQAFDALVCPMPFDDKDKFFVIVFVLAFLVSIAILSLEISFQFFRKWKQSLLEVEQYKSETAMARLENLKNQVNPHFLFNNMSVLSSLVYKDQDKAVDFINQLSKVYRYLLDSGSSELTTLEDEMQFLQSYTYLLNIRYSPNIHFDINVSDEALKTHIPPMSVQLLIENAIKHNEISSAAPLTISIRSEGMWLIVENNLQLRSTVENGSGTGLKNIRSRYQFFTDREPEIVATDTLFSVKIPLLKAP